MIFSWWTRRATNHQLRDHPMIEKWTYPSKLIIRSWFGGEPIRCFKLDIKSALETDISNNTSFVYAEDRGVGISRTNNKSVVIYSVFESDFHRSPLYGPHIGNVVTTYEVSFTAAEEEKALDVFIKLAKNPLKSIDIPDFIFLNDTTSKKVQNAIKRTK